MASNLKKPEKGIYICKGNGSRFLFNGTNWIEEVFQHDFRKGTRKSIGFPENQDDVTLQVPCTLDWINGLIKKESEDE